MQIEFENLSNEHFISSYGKNYLVINEKKYFDRVILLNSNIDECKSIKDLFCEKTFQYKMKKIGKENYNFILFGTGKITKNMPLIAKEFVIKNNIPYETMKSISAFKRTIFYYHRVKKYWRFRIRDLIFFLNKLKYSLFSYLQCFPEGLQKLCIRLFVHHLNLNQ